MKIIFPDYTTISTLNKENIKTVAIKFSYSKEALKIRSSHLSSLQTTNFISQPIKNWGD